MTPRPRITVAPNGARLQKADHPRLPVTLAETVEAARACHAAGADALHLHVRDAGARHSLDTDLYRTALAALEQQVPALQVQITTEAAGQFQVADQLGLLASLRPKAASIALREIARAPELAPQIYATAEAAGTQVQHILYGAACFDQLAQWRDHRIIPAHMRDAILVLGQYDPPRAASPDDLQTAKDLVDAAGLRMTVCAFGPAEEACLLAAARLGWDLRVGFENNMTAPDGSLWYDTAAAVTSLRRALDRQAS